MAYATKVDLTKKKPLPTKGAPGGNEARMSRLEIAAQNRSSMRPNRPSAAGNRIPGVPAAGVGGVGEEEASTTLFQMPEFSWEKLKKFRLSAKTWKRIQIGLLVFFGVGAITGIIGGLWLYSYIQKIDQELPSREDFFPNQELTSVVYDRKGVELAKFVGDKVASEVNIEDIPEKVKWAFLAAEDVDFYTHQGFDATGIAYCGVQYVLNGGRVVCGGSTITQQLVKLVLNDTDLTVERKLREMMMAIKIEQGYTKDEILELYLSVAGFGGNIYGITSASQFYFGKEVKDLTLAEAAILASVVQRPATLSPTLGLPDPVTAQAAVKARQESVVLAQMRRNIDKINNQTRINYDDQEMDDVVTREEIDAAFEEKLTYKPPVVTEWKAGHFVDYVKLRLQNGNYKFGEEPFTESELATGGYKIYTSLDYDIQQVAERSVSDAVKANKATYKMNNAAMILTTPDNGEIIAMVGSKNYFGQREGCDKDGRNCSFDPQVNIMLTKQSPGSSTKPFGFYEAYRQGLMHTGSFLPDIPISIDDKFVIKNYNSVYNGVGVKAFASQQLADSRNLPSIIVLEAIGIEKFLETMRTFGYTTYSNSSQFGYSVILGGSDVIGVEHAQGYGVLANNGYLAPIEVITKIEDRDGNVVYEHKPERERVADERAAFLTNQSILNNNSVSWDGRDVSLKTGTSQDNTDNWVAIYSPDFVALGWVGNNNNKPMSLNAYGESTVTPWLKGIMRQVGETEYFKAKTKFHRPAGVKRGGGCGESDPNKCIGSFVGISSGWMIEGFEYPADNVRAMVRVCKNQGARLARPIDEYYNNARDKLVFTYSMPYVPHWEKFLNDYMDGPQSQYGYEGMPNGGPKIYCNKTYDGAVESGVWISTTNITNGMTVGHNLNIQGSAFTLEAEAQPQEVTVRFDSEVIGTLTITNNQFSGDVTIPNSYDNGTYTLTLTAKDTANNNYVLSYSVVLGSVNSSNLQLTIPSASAGTGGNDYQAALGGGTIPVQIDYSSYTGGKNLTNEEICINKDGGDYTCDNVGGSGPVYSYNWNVSETGTYRMYFTAKMGSSGVVRSASKRILITP